jgi:hypothetical protein
LVFGSLAAYVDMHNATEVYPTLSVVLAGSFVLGAIEPRRAWRWALLAGVFVPLSMIAAHWRDMPGRLGWLGPLAILLVLMIPGMIGAYSGALLRKITVAAWTTK